MDNYLDDLPPPPLAEIQQAEAEAAKSAIRQKIGERAGDSATLLGVTADAAQLATLFLAVDIVALAQSEDFASYKATKLGMIADLAGDADIITLSGGLLAQIQAGELILPIMFKGVEKVLEDITQSGSAVAGVLADVYQAQAQG